MPPRKKPSAAAAAQAVFTTTGEKALVNAGACFIAHLAQHDVAADTRILKRDGHYPILMIVAPEGQQAFDRLRDLDIKLPSMPGVTFRDIVFAVEEKGQTTPILNASPHIVAEFANVLNFLSQRKSATPAPVAIPG